MTLESGGHGVILGLSAGTIITKVTKKPNNRVLQGLYCLVELFLLLYVILTVQFCKEAGLNNIKACMVFP